VKTRAIVAMLVPPFVYGLFRRVRGIVLSRGGTLRSGAALFDGDGALFIDELRDKAIYGEYGVGKSTKWVAKHTTATIVAVDTSRDWVDSVTRALKDSGRHEVVWIDVGPLGSWGRPLSYERSDRFIDYVESIWTRSTVPEVVLIDGRWRVACFLTSLLRAPAGTPIFFDDYVGRSQYHIVERFVRPTATCGRQVRFEVPASFDRDAVAKLRDAFLYVTD
jgi:hypothetical protein